MKALSAVVLAVGLILATPTASSASTTERRHQRCDRDDCESYGGGYQGRDDEGGYEYRRGGNGSQGDCQSGGCGNRAEKCKNSGDNCKSWSPTFDHSPIVICVQPGSCSDKGGQGPGGGGAQPSAY